MVYHMGKHTCWTKIDFRSRKAAIERQTQTKRTGPTKRIAIDTIAQSIGEGNLDQAAEEALQWRDTQYIRQLNRQQDEEYGLDMKSFNAVAIMKKKTDAKDDTYIYRINNGAMNDNADFVFKASKTYGE